MTVFDSGLDCDCFMTFLATNNYEAGQIGARTLAGLMGGKGPIAMLMHAPGSASTMDRERGFEDAIKAEFPGMKIVASQYGMSDRVKARAAMENMLAAHPYLEGIFASTEPSSIGAALAVKSAGKSGKLKFVGFDSSDSMVEDLKNGTIDALVVQRPVPDGLRIGQDPARQAERPNPAEANRSAREGGAEGRSGQAGNQGTPEAGC